MVPDRRAAFTSSARALLDAALTAYGIAVAPEERDRAVEHLASILQRLEALDRVATDEPIADLNWTDVAGALAGDARRPVTIPEPGTGPVAASPEPDDVLRLSLVETAGRIRGGDLSPVEVTEAALKRIELTNPILHAFLSVHGERALQRAREAAEAVAHGRWWGPLHGVPVALKDLIAEAGAPWTCGSILRRDVVADRDATVTARLRQAGAIFVGRTHLHEWAYGVSNNNPHFGPARNPWNPSRMPGGSSGGSAAALAACCIYGSLGTDTGGSIRIPAALCGVVGLKPTYRLASVEGVYPLSWSLDHVGPMARTADDVALLLEVIADRRLTGDGETNLRGVHAGIPRAFFWSAIDRGAGDAVDAAIDIIRALGAEVEEVALDGIEAASAVAAAILMVEASELHHHMLRSNIGAYGQDVRERLLAGLALPGEWYVRARRVRRALVRQIVDGVFRRVDVLLTPTVALPAPPIEEATTQLSGKSYNTRALLTRFTNPFNALGLPALAIPCGFAGGLPVSLQVVGRPFEEDTVLHVGRVYERARGLLPLPPTVGSR